MIYLNQIPQNQMNRLQNEKVVSVNVLSRNGTQAEVEVNGIKMNAILETNTPDRFLAFLVRDENGIQLRLLNSFKGTAKFQKINREQIIDQLNSFLFKSGLPMTEDNLKAGLTLLESGLNPDKQLIKLLKYVNINFGKQFTEVILGLMKNNMPIDMTLPELLFRLREIYRDNLKSNIFHYDPEKGFTQSEDTKPNSELVPFHSFMKNLFGSSFDAKLFEHEDNPFLIMVRRKKESEEDIYFIDLSNEKLGKMFAEIHLFEKQCRIKVKLEPELFRELNTKIELNKKVLDQRIMRILKDRQVVIQFQESENPYEFFIMEDGASSETITNLDIFA